MDTSKQNRRNLYDLMQENNHTMEGSVEVGTQVMFNGINFSDAEFFELHKFYAITAVEPSGVKLETCYLDAVLRIFIYPDGLSSFELVNGSN